jgi:hypothetical protein
MKKRPLLIASAGAVNPNLYGDLGRVLTSHIPLSGKLAILDQVEKATQIYDNVYVLIDSSAKNLGEVLKFKFGVIPILGEVDDSLSQAFRGAFDKIESDVGLDLLFGDSYTTDLLETGSDLDDLIFISKRTDSSSWKCIERDFSNSSLRFFNTPSNSFEFEVVTGSFCISDFSLFKKIHCEDIGVIPQENSFWNSWVLYDEIRSRTVRFKEDKSWQDIGHVDTYFGARRDLISKSSRSFNHITMDRDSLRITKTGVAEKILLEKKWFEEIPPELQIYTPTTYSSKVPHSYDIEYETSIPVNEMWISGNDEDSYWYLFGENLSQLLSVMHSINDSKIPVEKQITFKNEIFSTKVNQRVEAFLNGNDIGTLLRDKIKVNGKLLPKLQDVLDEIEEVSNKVSKLGNWSVIHGDLCLSNMIYDRRRNQLRLLDPRGSFVEEGIYGDPVYDLIKFSHSILGNYDYFACNLFSLSQFEREFELSIASSNEPRIAKVICEEVITSQIQFRGISYYDLRILESGLFLSASTLHTETDRGVALFLNGLQIASEMFLE